MGISTAQLRNVDRAAGRLREGDEEIGNERRVERADDPGLRPQVVHEVRSAAEIHGDGDEALVHRHGDRGVAHDALAIAERFIDRAAEHEAEVFHGVVLVHVEVALRLHREVEETVHGDELEHVVEERQSRIDRGFSRAVEREAHLDVGLLRASRPSPSSCRRHQTRASIDAA